MYKAYNLWQIELSNDVDNAFILDGVLNGFNIVDIDVPRPEKPIICKNYHSATRKYCNLAEKQIQIEIDSANYVITATPPDYVSALGAIPKPESSDIRLIHDLGRPMGGINQYATETSVCYPSIENAVKSLPHDAYIAKIDLKSAYRSVSISPECYRLTGLQWLFKGSKVTTFISDTKLPFGAAKSCKIFQTLTDSIVRMMARRGFVVHGYLDDYLVQGKTETECRQAYETLLQLLQDLGFQINYKKSVPPCQKLTFLGVVIDTINRVLELPKNKLSELKRLVGTFLRKKSATKLELQKLAGKLNWACKVVRGGRTFLRRIIDLSMSCKHVHHYVKLNKGAKEDIIWWATALDIFHGFAQFPCDIPLPNYVFATDASMEGGAGHFLQDWFYVNWALDFPEQRNKHITFLELETVVIAARRWGRHWHGLHIHVRSDNVACVAAINKSSSRSPELMSLIRELFWLSVLYDFKISASHIPGDLNFLADRLSRLNSLPHAIDAANMLSTLCSYDTPLPLHMSYETYVYLQMLWRIHLKVY